MSDWDKTDIIHFLSDLYGYQSYLELCTPTTGALYHKIDRSKFTTCHRLMYRCSPSFDDEMDVVVLNRELENAHPAARRLRKSFLQRRECGIGAQGGQPLPCAQCHVKRMTRMVQRAALMRTANLASRGLTPGARPLATPRAGSKLELDWLPCHA